MHDANFQTLWSSCRTKYVEVRNVHMCVWGERKGQVRSINVDYCVSQKENKKKTTPNHRSDQFIISLGIYVRYDQASQS